MGEKENKYAPVKRFVFPAGDCGGEIRINIPVTATAWQRCSWSLRKIGKIQLLNSFDK